MNTQKQNIFSSIDFPEIGKKISPCEEKNIHWENNKFLNANPIIPSKTTRPVHNSYHKTKVCGNIIKNGVCNREECWYAHDESELRYPLCIWDNYCNNKLNCQFKHSNESNELYYKRTLKKLPEFPLRSNTQSSAPKKKLDLSLVPTNVLMKIIKSPPPTPPQSKISSPLKVPGAPKKKDLRKQQPLEYNGVEAKKLFDDKKTIFVSREKAMAKFQEALEKGHVNINMIIL